MNQCTNGVKGHFLASSNSLFPEVTLFPPFSQSAGSVDSHSQHSSNSVHLQSMIAILGSLSKPPNRPLFASNPPALHGSKNPVIDSSDFPPLLKSLVPASHGNLVASGTSGSLDLPGFPAVSLTPASSPERFRNPQTSHDGFWMKTTSHRSPALLAPIVSNHHNAQESCGAPVHFRGPETNRALPSSSARRAAA